MRGEEVFLFMPEPVVIARSLALEGSVWCGFKSDVGEEIQSDRLREIPPRAIA